jgi:quercetin dioxygenase-like cupin family protein
MRAALFVVSTTFLLAIGVSTAAEGQTITVRPNEVKWSDIKDLPGWQEAVLSGDPTKEGPYVQRVKVPANALVPLHTHPDTENITVLTGSFGIGQGDKADKSKGQMLPAGSFHLLPADTAHFAWAGAKGAVIQIHGVGPSGMTMIQPEKK